MLTIEDDNFVIVVYIYLGKGGKK